MHRAALNEGQSDSLLPKEMTFVSRNYKTNTHFSSLKPDSVHCVIGTNVRAVFNAIHLHNLQTPKLPSSVMQAVWSNINLATVWMETHIQQIHPEDGGNRFLQDFYKPLPDCTVSYPIFVLIPVRLSNTVCLCTC